MKLITTFALAATLTLSAITAFADGHQADITADLNAFNDRFNEMAAAGDAAGLTALYADDSLWIAPGQGPIPGPEGAEATFGFMASQNGQNIHAIDHLFISDDGTMAVMVGDAEIFVESAGLDFTGTYQFVLRHDGNDWKIISDMYTVPEAPAE